MPSYLIYSSLFKKRLNLQQLNDSLDGYIPRFEELRLSCELEENLFNTVCRFINNLRVEIKRKLPLYILESLEEAYQEALEIEKYFKFPNTHKVAPLVGESVHSKSVSSSISTAEPSYCIR